MQEADSELLAYMTANGLNQIEMARQAKVSQPTISRALKGGLRKRRGKAYIRIFTYIHKKNRRAGVLRVDRNEVLQAFDRVWGASKAHAAAVAKVIDALDGLRPSPMEEE
jgi:predicted transcriptional regulator